MAFRSPFVDGKIVNPQSKEEADLIFWGESAYPYVQSIRIKSGWDVDMELEVTLNPPYEKALELCSKKNPFLKLGNTLALRWGYTDVKGAISPWSTGFMLAPEASFGEEISVTVSAVSYGFNTNRVARNKVWTTPDKPRTFKNVAEEIAQRYGMKAVFKIENARTAVALLQDQRVDLFQGGHTDLQFLMRVAISANATLIIRNDEFLFVDVDASDPDKKDVSATFQMYGKIDLANNIYPMLSFSPESMGLAFIANYQGLVSFARGPNDKPDGDAVPLTANETTSGSNSFSADKTYNRKDLDPDGPPGTAPAGDGKTANVKSTVKVDSATGEGGRMVVMPMSSEFAQKNAQDVLQAMQGGGSTGNASDHGITVTFETFAIPFLQPGMLVSIQGVGDYFSAVYKVKEIEVTVDSSGARMSVSCMTRGFPGLTAEYNAIIGDVAKSQAPAEGDPNYELKSAEEA